MNSLRKSAKHLADITPYDPKYIPAKIMNSANENPQDVSPHIKKEMLSAIDGVSFNRYPDPLANDLRDMIAQVENDRYLQLCTQSKQQGGKTWDATFTLTRNNVLVGNGGDELLFNLTLTYGGPDRTFLNVPPTFSVYENNAKLLGTNIVNISRLADFSLDEHAILKRMEKGDIDFVVITSPNNPSGDLADIHFIERLLCATDALVMIDEAYFEFAQKTCLPLLSEHKNLIILRTFSKAFSLAGVRVGYVLAHADVIQEFLKVRQPYSVDAISQEIAKVALSHREDFYAEAQAIVKERVRMFSEIKEIAKASEISLDVYPSFANYLLVRIENAADVWQKLFEAGILVRDFSHAKGLENCLRISIGTRQENDAFLRELEQIIKQFA